jgi:hypothetical protein
LLELLWTVAEELYVSTEELLWTTAEELFALTEELLSALLEAGVTSLELDATTEELD